MNWFLTSKLSDLAGSNRFAVLANPSAWSIRFSNQDNGIPVVCRGSVEQGSPLIVAVYEDITERRLTEERQAFLLKLSDMLRPLSDPVAILKTAMQVLGEHMQINRAFYGELLDDDDTLLIGPGYSHQLLPLEGYVSFAAFDSDMVKYCREGQTVIIHDLYKDGQLSAQAKAAFDAIQVQAAVGVPLVKGKKCAPF